MKNRIEAMALVTLAACLLTAGVTPAKQGTVQKKTREERESETTGQTEAEETESEIASETETETGTERELPDTAEYTIYNKTGSEITKLTITDNRLGKEVFSIVDPMEYGDAVKAEFRKTAKITQDTSYTLSYETSDGYKADYGNLEFMAAEIRLTGRIARQGNDSLDVIPEGRETSYDKAEYTFRNATGEEITELKLVNDITGEIAEDITDGLADGQTCTVVIDPDHDTESETEASTESETNTKAENGVDSTADKDVTYTVIFRTDSGYEGRSRVPGIGTAEVELIGGSESSHS